MSNVSHEDVVAAVLRLRAVHAEKCVSHDRLLAAAKLTMPVLLDYRANAEDYEALDVAFDALQAAIAAAEEQAS